MNVELIVYLMLIMLMSFFAGTYVDVIAEKKKTWWKVLFFLSFAIGWAFILILDDIIFV